MIHIESEELTQEQPALAQETSEFVTQDIDVSESWHMPLSSTYFPKQVYTLTDICDSKLTHIISREHNDIELINAYIPNIKDHLDIRLLQMILSSYEMLSFSYPLAEYTTMIFGIAKASEQILYSLINAGQFSRNETDILELEHSSFSRVFAWNSRLGRFVLNRAYRACASVEFREYICRFYSYYNSCRNRYFHSNALDYIDIAMVSSYEEAKDIINAFSALIDEASKFI